MFRISDFQSRACLYIHPLISWHKKCGRSHITLCLSQVFYVQPGVKFVYFKIYIATNMNQGNHFISWASSSRWFTNLREAFKFNLYFKMAKTYKFINKGSFKKGHCFKGNQHIWPLRAKKKKKAQKQVEKIIVRLTHLDFKRVTKPTRDGLHYRLLAGKTPGSSSFDAMLLRPKATGTQDFCSEYMNTNEIDSEMRLVDKNKVSEMWNTALAEHTRGGSCNKIQLRVVVEKQKGLCWKQGLGCSNCAYKTPLHKLYRDVNSTTRYLNVLYYIALLCTNDKIHHSL